MSEKNYKIYLVAMVAVLLALFASDAYSVRVKADKEMAEAEALSTCIMSTGDIDACKRAVFD